MVTGSAPLVALVVLAALLLSACSDPARVDPEGDPDQVDAVEAPPLGACRQLSLEETAAVTNATRIVDCAKPHTAQTYAVGDLPEEFAEADYDSAEVGAFAYRTCTSELIKFLGGDESITMRSILGWSWFRPSEKAWDKGARWYRCDVTGGAGPQSASLVPLPEKAKGLLQGRPDDAWMACAAEPAFSEAAKVPCSEDHLWRAVTTIKLGEINDPYPGDEAVEAQTGKFCQGSVKAYLNYPDDFEFAYTWFGEKDWAAGNRRSVCWAKTDE